MPKNNHHNNTTHTLWAAEAEAAWIELAWWESQLVLAARSGTYLLCNGSLSWAFTQSEFNCNEEDPRHGEISCVCLSV